jgi:hypothetical protein
MIAPGMASRAVSAAVAVRLRAKREDRKKVGFMGDEKREDQCSIALISWCSLHLRACH